MKRASIRKMAGFQGPGARGEHHTAQKAQALSWGPGVGGFALSCGGPEVVTRGILASQATYGVLDGRSWLVRLDQTEPIRAELGDPPYRWWRIGNVAPCQRPRWQTPCEGHGESGLARRWDQFVATPGEPHLLLDLLRLNSYVPLRTSGWQRNLVSLPIGGLHGVAAALAAEHQTAAV